MKLTWRVAPAPEGPYRSFEQRAWPSAKFRGTDHPAAQIQCEDAYRPALVRGSTHQPLTVYVADHSAAGQAFKVAAVEAEVPLIARSQERCPSLAGTAPRVLAR